MKTALFLSLLFTALAMAAGFAHLFELLNKMKLSAEDYLTVQQIYRGWSLLGIVVFGSLFSDLALTVMARKNPKIFRLALTAFLCIVGTQIIFWTFTYPVNQQTANWTVLPANWLELRNRWEYSHAASALLDLQRSSRCSPHPCRSTYADLQLYRVRHRPEGVAALNWECTCLEGSHAYKST